MKIAKNPFRRLSDSGQSFDYCTALAAALCSSFELPDNGVRVHTEKDTGPHWHFVSVRGSRATARVNLIDAFCKGFDAGWRSPR